MNLTVKNRSYPARGRTRLMSVRSKLPFRWTITLLLAAMGFMQVCGGYARSLERAAVASTAVTGDGCCDTNQANGCATAGAADPTGSCAPVCAQPRHTVTLDSAVAASGMPAVASTAESDRFRFPEKPPALTAGPPAISSTPLIYHLQRLLN